MSLHRRAYNNYFQGEVDKDKGTDEWVSAMTVEGKTKWVVGNTLHSDYFQPHH
jgi:hypothetical protein